MAKDEIHDEAQAIADGHGTSADTAIGVANVEATQQVWGKVGRYLVITGVGLSMIVYELDNSTVYNYRPYALSAYNNISISTTLLTAATILFAVCKPLYAKLADVIGRGETYVIAVLCFLLSYILCAASKNVATYAVGTLFHSLAATGMNIMNDIVVSDITSPRWRVFGLSCAFLPFLIVPWCGGFIVDSVVSPNGIGWRWGYGILCIIMPVTTSFIVITLVYYQTKAKRAGLAQRTSLTLTKFLSQTDAAGLFLLMAGFAMFLLPINLAALTSSRWSTSWIPAVLAVGIVTIIACVLYETFVAMHPVLPARYFADPTIVCCFLIALCDQIGFEGTHAYLYTWSVITKNYTALQATYLTYVNGVTQTLVSILVGLWIAQKKYHFSRNWSKKFPFFHLRLERGDAIPSYGAVLVIGASIRLIGYGVMLRIRGSSNSDAELYIVQLIQGLGTGFISILVIVAAQLRVSHAEMAQITSLVLLFQFAGAALGDTYAGAIYTNYFRERLRSRLGSGVSESVVTAVDQSITSTEIPINGTPERTAINSAYSDVMRLMTYVALAFSVVLFALCVALCFTKQSRVNLAEDKLPGLNGVKPNGGERMSIDAREASVADAKSAKDAEV